MIFASILMPVKNEARFLAESLESVQPVQGMMLQVVLVDDHSTDDTYEIAKDIAARREDLQIVVLRNTGRGKAAALNLAFEHARSDHFILLAGDDLLVSDVLPSRIAAVTGNGPELAQCRYRSFSGNPDHDGMVFPRHGRHNHLAGGAVSFNRAFADLYFPIPESLPNEDTWLWAIATLHGLRARLIDNVGLHYRIHDRNSVGPSFGFTQTSEGLARRHAAFAMALQQPGGTDTGRAALAMLMRAEEHRRAGRWWRIAGLADIPYAERAMFLANATPWLFALKRRLVPWLKSKKG